MCLMKHFSVLNGFGLEILISKLTTLIGIRFSANLNGTITQLLFQQIRNHKNRFSNDGEIA